MMDGRFHPVSIATPVSFFAHDIPAFISRAPCAVFGVVLESFPSSVPARFVATAATGD